MGKISTLPYRGYDHGSFDEEWGCHKYTSEWWYVTGYFRDDSGKMYSYQFTLVRTPLLGIFTPHVLMLALTDFSTGKHTYTQKTALLGGDVTIDNRSVQYGDTAMLAKNATGMHYIARHKDFALDLLLDYGKGPVWHGDNGVLRMGVDDPRETTLYYSYTNMPTVGTLTLHGKAYAVKGKSWFDRQGGPYSIMNRKTHWEWFSLRFFDDEEMMLFSFPQCGYQDGTYISKEGQASRLTNYTIKAMDFVTVREMKYSAGWKLDVPGLKEQHYTIRPLLEGQVNLAYCEQLAGIYNLQDEQVGLCFVELLPGVYNAINPLHMFQKVE